MREYSKEYYKENKDGKIKEYRQENKDKLKGYGQSYYIANREAIIKQVTENKLKRKNENK